MDDSTSRTPRPAGDSMGSSPSSPLVGVRRSDAWDEPVAATILVAEDDEPIRLALGELLQLEGYDVVLACDGVDALDKLSREAPALLVTDLEMPRLDGAGLCRRVREHDAELPIVVLSAAHDLSPVRRYADAVVRKPFDIDVLIGMIAQFIRPTLPPRSSLPTSSGRFRPVTTPSSRLELFVTAGSTACDRAARAIRDVLRARARHLGRAPALELIDIGVEVDRATRAGVAMTPTLVHEIGGTRHLCVGDLCDERVLQEFLGDVRT